MKDDNRKIFIKILFFVLGVFINSFAIVLITKGNLGTSQISSIPYVLSLIYENLTFGTATFILNVVFLLGQIFILKGKINIKILLQLPASFLLGYFINLNMVFLDFVNPDGFILKLICLLLGCVILAFGISIEVAPDIVKIPGEGIVFTISKEKNIKFGRVKVLFDIILVLIALVISFVSFHEIRGLGLGTVISALLVGKMVNVFDKYLNAFYLKYLG